MSRPAEELKALFDADKKKWGYESSSYKEFVMNIIYEDLDGALSRGNTRKSNKMLDDHASNINFNINRLDPHRLSFLHSAAYRGNSNIGVSKRLIDLGVEIDGLDIYGNTPLCTAAKHNQAKMVILLLEAGADVNVKNHKGLDVVSHIKKAISNGLEVNKDIMDLLERQAREKASESMIQLSTEISPTTLREKAQKLTLVANQMLQTAAEMLKTAQELEIAAKKLPATSQKLKADTLATKPVNSNSVAVSAPLSFQNMTSGSGGGSASGSGGGPAIKTNPSLKTDGVGQPLSKEAPLPKKK